MFIQKNRCDTDSRQYFAGMLNNIVSFKYCVNSHRYDLRYYFKHLLFMDI